MKSYEVKRIERDDCADFILNVHYAKRWPSITYAFGLFDGDEIIWVITYGTPPSSTLRRGVAGDENISNVIELNRLCLKYNRKNEASKLISLSLKMLPKGKIIISFADKSQGHNGCVYRASNFTYHGLSAKRTDWALKSKPNLHGQTVADEFRGQKNRSALMREKYGDDFYLKPRPRKHRYIYITGNKYQKKILKSQLKYKETEFAKGQ